MDKPETEPDKSWELDRKRSARRRARFWDDVFGLGECVFALAAWPLALAGFLVFKFLFV